MLLLFIGCTDRGQSDEAFCRRLAEPPPDSRWDEADLIVFVHPEATDDEIAAIRTRIDAIDEVESYTWVDQQRSYDEFVEMFAASPDMVAAVRPKMRPLTVEAYQQVEALTRGRTNIQLAEVAPGEFRQAAGVLDAFWADPGGDDGPTPARVAQAAREIAAYFDTECQ
jgi:hypothetical protein